MIATTGSKSNMLTDLLTGLLGRAALVQRSRWALHRAVGAGWTVALVLADIDDFRSLNDRLGQVAGDRILIEMADRIDRAFPSTSADPSEMVGRFAGDQLAVVCIRVAGDADQTPELVRRLTLALSAPVVLDSGPIEVTCGIGIALGLPGELTVDELIRRAESALRRAKADGPGGCHVFGDSPETEGAAFRALRRAIDEGEFELFYQAKVALATDRIAGVEALVRWNDPTGGMIPPLDFIPLAEETGLIVPLGAWVIEEACRQARGWLTSFPERPPLTVSVNVSVGQFGPELVDIVTRALLANDIPPQYLCIEVTESILMADVEAAHRVLGALTELGVRLSIDDFGTGYSSLAYLNKFPVDELKVDKSFVQGLGTNPRDTAIVAAVISTAHALDLDVVAEGVETIDQLQRLRTLGCDEAQGFYFARPSRPAQIDALLHAESDQSWLKCPSTGPVVEPAGYRPQRVLVVEDDEDVRKLVMISLSAIGLEVHLANDGESGLLSARALTPDCVLLDIAMPGMSGFDVCRVLRAEPKTANCAILMLSAHNDAADKVEAFGSGADDYIVKPFSPRDLVSRLNAALLRGHSPTDLVPVLSAR